MVDGYSKIRFILGSIEKVKQGIERLEHVIEEKKTQKLENWEIAIESCRMI
jgi:hypothetical protein